ncbi:ABC transporter substrate-binding protein [Clostridium sediminicola]|uniref:glycine betaine ABC transporter substrate-binding protein n=1 Tax=Clostridium sediminicola TaxID=3114879 RepID=UPI0031F2637A
MKKIKKLLLIIVSSILITSLAGCASQPKKIVIGEGDWDSCAFHDQVAKLIIEEGYGKSVDIVTADTAVMISGFKTKDIDLSMELWSDNVPTYDEDIAKGDYVILSTNYDDNMQGLYVPKYLIEEAPDLKTVEDLKKYPNLFPDPEGSDKGIIYGGPEGWGATEFLHKKMKEYGLDESYSFKTIDSSATLSATLASAYEKGEPWVGYSWEPTWIMGKYDMVLLQDSEYSDENYEKGIGSFTSVDVQVAANSDFKDNYTEIADFLSKYKTSSKLTSNALAYMQENEAEADEAAKWFLNENKDLMKEWVTEDAYNKVIEAIQ